MGFIKPYLPDVDPDTFLKKPLMERMRILAVEWAENGFGAPRMVHTIYIVKLVVFFAIGGITVATLTSGLPAFWHVSQWWNQPIVYQKVILWTVLLETIGIAGSWGPLAGKIKPMTGGILFWMRPGTIRLRPWKWVPFTNGDRRNWFDIGLYLALLVSLAVALLERGVHSDSLSKALPANISGLVNPALLVAPMVLLVLIGLRDKTIFLAARGEQYFPALFFFAVLPFTDMIIALKMLIVLVWVGAGFSKFGKHFANVIPPMVSNTIFAPKWVRRAHYRDFPRNLRPSRLADFMAHVNGTTVEIAAPLVLFFSTNKWLTLAAVVLMVGFHLFIISTFPLAVPLEWNVVFAYTTILLFLGFPNWNGYAPGTCRRPGWLSSSPPHCCSSRCWATCGPTRSPSCLRYGSTQATGPPRCGLSHRVPRRSSTGSPARRGTRSTSSSTSATNRTGPRSPRSGPSRGAPCTARAAVSSRCC